MAEHQVIGQSIPRIDSLDKVTGKLKFTSDERIQGMLYGKILRSPYAHAKIVSIDTSRAEAFPGVRAVITGKDAPDKRGGAVRYYYDQYVLAKNEVLFAGEAVAAVAADTLEIAENAIDLIDVKYRELPGVFDVEKAWDTNPPVVLHPDLPNYEKATPVSRLDADRPNVCHHQRVYHGDVRKGFAQADYVFENRYTTGRVQHAPFESHTCIASVESDGGIVLRGGRQQLSGVRAYMARTFGLPYSKIRAISTYYIGGAFGSKFLFGIEPIAVLLAKKSGRPVRIALSRREVFEAGGNRIPCVIYIKDGVKKDGTIVAREMRILVNIGAYASSGGSILTRNSSFGAVGIYKLPNLKFDSYGVYTNEPPVCAMRGFAHEQAIWAVESQLDMIAEKLGMDPVQIRKKNILEEGDINANNQIVHSIGAKQCLDKVAGYIQLNKKPEQAEGPWRRGKGLAVGTKFSYSGGASITHVKILEDGSLEVRFSADDFGQGSNTVMAQIAADEFGLTVDKVKIVWADSAITPFSTQTVSQGTTFNTGKSTELACLDAKKRLFEIAAGRLGVTPLELATKEGRVFVKSEPARSITIAELYKKGFVEGVGEIMGVGIWTPTPTMENLDDGQVAPELSKQGLGPSAFFAYTAQAAQVAVNTETGEIKVEKFASAADMGYPINPKMCEQQIEGGVGMGIGTTLWEEMKMEKGVVLNSNFRDYKMPDVSNMPYNDSFKAIIAPVPHKDGPYGAKGFSEVALTATAPAISNAIYNAVGVRVTGIPITREKMLKALKKEK